MSRPPLAPAPGALVRDPALVGVTVAKAGERVIPGVPARWRLRRRVRQLGGDRARQQCQRLGIGGGECLRVVGVDAERADRLAVVDEGCSQPVRRDGAENVVVDDLVAGGQLDCGRLRADHLEREHGHDLGDRLGFGPCCGDLGLRLHDGKQLLFPVHPRQIGARALELEPVPIWADRRRASAGGWFAASNSAPHPRRIHAFTEVADRPGEARRRGRLPTCVRRTPACHRGDRRGDEER